MPDQYLTVNDFLAYDTTLSKKIGRIDDNVSAVKEQVNTLTTAFTSYVAETDRYRLETDKRLTSIEVELAGIKQTMSQGFARLFAHLGI